ncbi:MAG TPA: hypothetical protein VK925_02955 [Jiangellaceae bacterium]|nr:hypothetical protein [Jiangellaceae bacterium]
MSRSKPDSSAAAGTPELDEIAGQLYALHPDEFVAARDEQVKAARAAGAAPLAKDLARLRRPTRSAWLVNVLWRDQREVMEELFELADGFRAALAQGSGKSLHKLTAQRRAIEAALLKRAQALADEAGVPVSADLLREAQETLGAALSSPEVAAEVRSGRLVKPVSYAGFGGAVPDLRVVPGGRPTTGERDEKAADEIAEDETSAEDGTSAEDAATARRRAAAQRRLREAREAVDNAEAELVARMRAAEEAERRHAELSEHVERLRNDLREEERRAAAAADAADTEVRRRRRAEQALDEARAAHERAERQSTRS